MKVTMISYDGIEWDMAGWHMTEDRMGFNDVGAGSSRMGRGM